MFSFDNIFNPLYAVALITVGLCTASLLVNFVPFFKNFTEPDDNRYRALDGLRGLLAFGVFIHHASIRNICEQTGYWVPPKSDLYNFLGPGCVAIFFMITGFLFWSKGLSKPKSVSYPRLLKGRILRLVPMYLVSYGMVLLLVGIATHFTTRESLPEILESIAIGSTAGAFGMPDVNGYSCGRLNAGVIWSLYYEWRFYVFLPVLVFCFKGTTRLFYLTSAVLFLILTQDYDWLPHVANFVAGMITAQIHQNSASNPVLASKAFRAMATVLLLLTAFAYNHLPYLVTTIGIFPFFLSVIYGHSCRGLFTSRPCVLLGAMAYSLYLMHGMFLHVYTYAINHSCVRATTQSAFCYWMLLVPLAVANVLISSTAFRYVELPFINQPKK